MFKKKTELGNLYKNNKWEGRFKIERNIRRNGSVFYYLYQNVIGYYFELYPNADHPRHFSTAEEAEKVADAEYAKEVIKTEDVNI